LKLEKEQEIIKTPKFHAFHDLIKHDARFPVVETRGNASVSDQEMLPRAAVALVTSH